jgi:hypothetical protein
MKHAHFLTRLAYLEKQGFKKLQRYKNKNSVTDPEFLEHINDEARHFSFLQKEASKLHFQGTIDLHTKNYLSKLEVYILRHFEKSPKLCYLLLTYVIEKRAEILYPVYEAVLQKSGSLFSVQTIIDDELKHLEDVGRGIDRNKMGVPLENLREFENFLFNTFMATYF